MPAGGLDAFRSLIASVEKAGYNDAIRDIVLRIATQSLRFSDEAKVNCVASARPFSSIEEDEIVPGQHGTVLRAD